MSCKKMKLGFTPHRHAEELVLSICSAFKKQGVDPEQKLFRMTLCNIGGFTLIEVLVVVLIIAVLTAVAVPQYKKAVLKSRFSTLYPMVQALSQGQESFYLNNGDYAQDLSELDVSVPGASGGKSVTLPDGTQVKLGVEENHIYVRADKDNNALLMYQTHSPNFAGETHCEAKQEDALANWLCEKGLDGKLVGNKFGYTIYSLSPQSVGTLARTYYDLPAFSTISDGDNCIGTRLYACEYATIKNGSTCTSEVYGSCMRLELVDNYSRCIVPSTNGGGGCNQGSKFNDHSSCFTWANSGCSGYFTDHSTCAAGDSEHKNIGWACNSSSFDGNSTCSSYSRLGCVNSHFMDHSVCQSYVKGACGGSDFDGTSYCEGTYCPVDSPKQGGGTWQLCDGESEGGKTC